MVDLLEEDEVVDRIREWWRKNGLSLAGGLILIVAGWSGWNWYDARTEEHAQAAFDQFSQYVELRTAGEADGEEALEILALLDGQYQGSGAQLLSLLYRAGDAVAEGELAQAVGYLEDVLEAAPGGQVETLAALRLARIHIAQDALDEAQALLDSTDGAGFLAMKQELQGDLHASREDWDSARAAYQAALESEEAAELQDTWPFLSMKIHAVQSADDDPLMVAVAEGEDEDVLGSVADADEVGAPVTFEVSRDEQGEMVFTPTGDQEGSDTPNVTLSGVEDSDASEQADVGDQAQADEQADADDQEEEA